MLVKPSIIRPHGTPTVLLFGESPGQEEVREGKAFVGQAGRLLRDVLRVELPTQRIILDNVCPEDLKGAKPNAEFYQKYANYRRQSIKRFRPEVIVLLGEHAMKAFDQGGGVLKNNSRIFDLAGFPPMVGSVHPAYVLRSRMAELEKFQPVFQTVRACCEGKKRASFDYEVIRPAELPDPAKLYAIDLETTSLLAHQGDILCAAISNGEKTWVLPVYHNAAEDPENALMALSDWWRKGPRIVHNAKFELSWFRWLSAKDPAQVVNTLSYAWLYDENALKGLGELAVTHLKARPWWSQVEFDRAASHRLFEYNARDAYYTYHLFNFFRRELTPQQVELADNVLTPLAMALQRMETRGMFVDKRQLEALTRTVKRRIQRHLSQVRKTFPDLNVRSSPQLRKLLFEQLKLTTEVKKTKGGLQSVDKEIISQAAQQDARFKPLAQARKWASFQSRVCVAWPKLMDDRSLLHTEFSFGKVLTGRLSSTKPNLQNIDRDGPQRPCLTSRYKGGSIIQLDYAQHELRIKAAVSQDERMLKLFEKGVDVHQQTANELNCARTLAKNINFSLIYLITPWGLEQKYNIPVKQGRELSRAWNALYPQMVQHTQETIEYLRQHRYVKSIFGWRRHLPNPQDNHQVRQGVNFVIQNPAVVICFIALVEIERSIPDVVVNQVHDSIILDVPAKRVKAVSRDAQDIMEAVRTPVPIPLKVDVKIKKHF